MELQVTGIDIGVDECIPRVEISDNSGIIGTAYGQRNAYLFSEADTMFMLLKKAFFGLERDDYMAIEMLIDRIENSPELTYEGMTMQDFLNDIIR